jgi:hypothetical protein
MLNRRFRISIIFLVTCLGFAATATTAQAGTIYLTRESFLQALLATLQSPNVAEDFEGFAAGPAANPLTIMGGAAELADTAPSILVFENLIGGPSPSQAWMSNVDAAGNAVTIAGVGGAPLQFSALGFDFAHQFPGNWSFFTSFGLDLGPGLGEGLPAPDGFVGWIGAPGEFLTAASYGGGGIILDNMVGTTPVSEPVTLLLLGGGLAAVAWGRRRIG